MSHVGAETFAAHRIVKAFGAEEREAGRFRDALQRLYRTNMRVVRALSLMPPAMELLGGIGMAAALWYGSNEIAAGRLTTGEFTTFLAALLMMYAPAKKLSRVNANLQQAIAAGRADLRDDGHAHGGRGVARRRAAAAVRARHRVPRRQLRV